MNDDREAFERDLRTRLAIDPSSNLQARIRARAFSAPVKRTPPFQEWFAWTSGLTAAAAAIVLLVIYSQPKASDNIAAPPRRVVKAPVAEPPAPAPPALRPTKSPAPTPAKHPVLIEIPMVAAANTGLNSGQIELPPLTGLELTSAVTPLPQAPALSIASLQPINIEPLTFAVQNMGVNE